MKEQPIRKMNPEVKEIWTDALDSGEYLQCQNALEHTDKAGVVKNCCLGVLCRKFEQHTGVKLNWEEGGILFLTKDGDEEKTWTLPQEVADWAGLDANPKLRPILLDNQYHENYQGKVTASGLNDNGATFTEISQLIKDNL